MAFSTKAIAECIEVQKINGHLGFSVWGGLDVDGNGNPFQPGKKGIFVLDVDQNGPASNSGIRKGDQILQIDGYDMTLATNKQQQTFKFLSVRSSQSKFCVHIFTCENFLNHAQK